MLPDANFSRFMSLVLRHAPDEVGIALDENLAIQGDRIRAVKGHSVQLDLGLRAAVPPDTLYHGTKLRFLIAILGQGLTRQERHHVHLSADIATAAGVAGRRKGDDVLLRIDAKAMADAGHPFFISENGVWLTEKVPPVFLSRIDPKVEA